MIHIYKILLLGVVIACNGDVLASNAQISAKAEPHKNVIVLGEPLFITTSIKNDGEIPLRLHYLGGSTFSSHGAVGIVLVSKNGKNYMRWIDDMGPCLKVAPYELKPGEEITSELLVLYNRAKGLAFSEKGTYYLCVEYLVTDGQTARTAPFCITVQEPIDDNLLVWNRIRNLKEYGELVQAPLECNISPKDIEMLSQLSKEHPKSVYMQYLGLGIARYYLKGTGNSDKALQYLKSLRDIEVDIMVQQKRQELENIAIKQNKNKVVVSQPTINNLAK